MKAPVSVLLASAGVLSLLIGILQNHAAHLSCTFAQRYGWIAFPVATIIAVIGLRKYRKARQPEWMRDLSMWDLAGAVGLSWFAGMFMIGPSLGGAAEFGKLKRTVADIRGISTTVEAYRARVGSCPVANSIEELIETLGKHPMPQHDGWGREFVVTSAQDSYQIVSYGQCSEPDVTSGGDYARQKTSRFSADIVMRDGEFIQRPVGSF